MSGEPDLEHVMRLMRRYGIAAFDYGEGNLQLSLRIEGGAAGEKPSESPPTDRVLAADAFGTFRLSHPATGGDPPEFPRRVAEGAVVGYLAVGPLLRPVRAKADCLLLRPLMKDGAEIGYGDPLFAIR